MERNNSIPNINYLLNKVENVSKRESLNHYLDILKKYDEEKCFYCGKSLEDTDRSIIHIDHFIPWSFVQSDNLWNLVLACRMCNLKKNDKLAEKKFLIEILDRNDCLINNMITEDIFYLENYRSEKLIQLYKYSSINGISSIWSPS